MSARLTSRVTSRSTRVVWSPRGVPPEPERQDVRWPDRVRGTLGLVACSALVTGSMSFIDTDGAIDLGRGESDGRWVKLRFRLV